MRENSFFHENNSADGKRRKEGTGERGNGGTRKRGPLSRRVAVGTVSPTYPYPRLRRYFPQSRKLSLKCRRWVRRSACGDTSPFRGKFSVERCCISAVLASWFLLSAAAGFAVHASRFRSALRIRPGVPTASAADCKSRPLWGRGTAEGGGRGPLSVRENSFFHENDSADGKRRKERTGRRGDEETRRRGDEETRTPQSPGGCRDRIPDISLSPPSAVLPPM